MWVGDSRFDQIATIILRQCLARDQCREFRYCWIDVHCDDVMCTANSGSSQSCIAYEWCVRGRLVHLRQDQRREFLVLLDQRALQWSDVYADSGLIWRALPRYNVYADDSFTTPTRLMWACDSRFDRIAMIILRQCLARSFFQPVNPCFWTFESMFLNLSYTVTRSPLFGRTTTQTCLVITRPS